MGPFGSFLGHFLVLLFVTKYCSVLFKSLFATLADDDFNDDDDVKSCPGVKSRAMDRCFCWITTARGLNQLF